MTFSYQTNLASERTSSSTSPFMDMDTSLPNSTVRNNTLADRPGVWGVVDEPTPPPNANA